MPLSPACDAAWASWFVSALELTFQHYHLHMCRAILAGAGCRQRLSRQKSCVQTPPIRPPRAAAALPRHPSALPKHARSLARPQHLAPPQSLARHRLVSPSNPSRRRKVPRRSESGTRRRTRPAGDAARSPSTFRRRCAPRAATRAPRCAGLTGPRKRCGGARTARAACAT